MRRAVVVLALLATGCGTTVDGDPTPVAVCPDGGEPVDLDDGVTLAVGECALLPGFDTPAERFTSASSSDDAVLAPDGADPRLFTGRAPGDVVVTVLSYSADCDEGPCATENDDVELRVTVTG
ncbi:hypothetical protein F1C76_08650 [Geodermatophilaceae bacterium NBWT11]|nr:hypothetical protein F1C76_08650 [Geodermatophilaceae bacterium NBWT11]